ncbi:MAG: SprT-like domain-containing protein [Nitrospirota bacterium]|nr:SprT-like domain-containing protein [Nitrospirota bacterium]
MNLRYFDGGLPPIEIVWSRRLTASAGLFVSHGGPRALPAGLRRRRIRLSAPLLRDGSPVAEREVLATLAHEMIHQWQFDILKRRPNHGPDFRRKMEDMNRAGLGVTVRHDLTEAVQRLAKYAWRCLDCGRTYERQRRTIEPRRHRCGSCRGALGEISPAQGKRQAATGSGKNIGLPLQMELGFRLH